MIATQLIFVNVFKDVVIVAILVQICNYKFFILFFFFFFFKNKKKKKYLFFNFY